MKLDQSHIGKMVRNLEWSIETPAKVIAVHGGKVWLFRKDDDLVNYLDWGDWELVAEPQKPSERIGELMGKPYTSPIQWNSKGLDASDTAIQAIVEFLDEQAEKSK